MRELKERGLYVFLLWVNERLVLILSLYSLLWFSMFLCSSIVGVFLERQGYNSETSIEDKIL
jgi:hypothetical protein